MSGLDAIREAIVVVETARNDMGLFVVSIPRRLSDHWELAARALQLLESELHDALKRAERRELRRETKGER